jgi:hypothetical protein
VLVATVTVGVMLWREYRQSVALDNCLEAVRANAEQVYGPVQRELAATHPNGWILPNEWEVRMMAEAACYDTLAH